MSELFGLAYTGRTEESVTYISPTAPGDKYMLGQFTRDYPLVMFESQPTVTGTPKGDVLGTLTLPYTVPNAAATAETPFFASVDMNDPRQRTLRFASIHSNPPGVFTDAPAMVSARYGKGQCVWSAAPIERPNREQHSEIFARIIADLCAQRFVFTLDAPEYVEAILFDAPEEHKKVVSVINVFESFHIPAVTDITLRIPCTCKPSSVTRVSDSTVQPFTWINGECVIKIDRLACCEMLLIEA